MCGVVKLQNARRKFMGEESGKMTQNNPVESK